MRVLEDVFKTVKEKIRRQTKNFDIIVNTDKG